MDTFIQRILSTSIHGSIVILVVLLLRLLLRKAPKKYICFLWMLAGLRLLIPVPLQSSLSLQPYTISIPLPIHRYNLTIVFWLLIAFVIASYSAISYLLLHRKVMDAVKVPGGWESDKIDTAFVLGFVKPKIYIPAGMSESTRRQILAHERTHLDKGDHWIKVIGFLALALHWFNPLVWLAYILLCKDIEIACDERVVQFMELNERKAYSSALLDCSTNHVHYAACPVAFGEVSVKYRIKYVLSYRKPSFWISLLGVLSILFVAVTLLTGPVQADTLQSQVLQNSRLSPIAFTPPTMPECESNPDWGVDVLVDTASLTGGKLVFLIDGRYLEASESITIQDGFIEKWNGNSWEALECKSITSKIFENQMTTFGATRESQITPMEIDLDWSRCYGTLPCGDYRIAYTVESATDTATFHSPFHIYREPLPDAEEAALARCITALNTVISNTNYSLLFSEQNPAGGLSPVERLSRYNDKVRTDYFFGSYCIGTGYTEGQEALLQTANWETPYLLDQNRRFLFPKDQSVISQDEITFCSVWTDAEGEIFHGKDTFLFLADGNLNAVERVMQKVDASGDVLAEKIDRIDITMGSPLDSNPYISYGENYQVEDSFTAQNNSPWKIFFRIDDDLLKPTGGEVWLSTGTVGISNYTTDGRYWIEKRNGNEWIRLDPDKQEASWGDEIIPIRTKTTVVNLDWSAHYGKLESGIYRMGKWFYNGDKSMIQYAQFQISATGGVYGQGAEDALARVDAALDKLKNGSYRIETAYGVIDDYFTTEDIEQIIWKYGDTEVYDVYNGGFYSHSFSQTKDDGFMYQDWSCRCFGNEEYACYFFPEEYAVISDQEISFGFGYSQTAYGDPLIIYSYRFDENGNLFEIIHRSRCNEFAGRYTRYTITSTPEEEIHNWVSAKIAQAQ